MRKMIICSKAGFSMMEILVAITLIAIFASSVFGSSIQAKRSARLTQDKLLALQLIEKKIGDIRKDDAHTIAADATGKTVSLPIPDLNNGVMFVTGRTLDGDDNLKEVTVTVKWDLPWKDKVVSNDGKCAADVSAACDRQETGMSIFYGGY